MTPSVRHLHVVASVFWKHKTHTVYWPHFSSDLYIMYLFSKSLALKSCAVCVEQLHKRGPRGRQKYSDLKCYSGQI